MESQPDLETLKRDLDRCMKEINGLTVETQMQRKQLDELVTHFKSYLILESESRTSKNILS